MFHITPQMQNYTYFSCEVVTVDKMFYINALHNQFLLPKDIQDLNRTRKVQASDFVLDNIKVVVKRDIFNESECFDLYFLEDLTFYENHTVISCRKGDTRYYCGNFKLIFNQGIISHLHLKSQKFARLDWGGSLVETLDEDLPKEIAGSSFPIEQNDDWN